MDPRLRHQGDDEQRFSVLAEKVLLLDGWGAVAVLLISYTYKDLIMRDNILKVITIGRLNDLVNVTIE